MTKLTSDVLLKVPFQRNAEGYRKSTTPVHEALQEALVNALIHSDYRGQGGIVVDRYPDRFEFSNPGTLLISYEQIARGSISECRNKSLQRMFQMLGVGDKAGSGIDKIRTSWAAQHWQSPSLKETFRPDRVWLELPLVSMLSDDLLAQLKQQFGAGVDGLNREEVQAVATAATEGSVSNQQLQEMLPLHRVDITKMLQGLVREGYLVSDGIGRGTTYQLASGFVGGVNSPISGGISPISEGNSPINDGLPLPTGDIDPTLAQIAQSVRDSKRATQDEVVATILKLCEGRFLTLNELSRLLDRKPKGLREVYLSGLVRSQQLQLRYPERLNHPQQSYMTRKTT